MGLSGRKQKQRIPNDPRNLSWADDASRFGSSYLSKFGWDASKGLGATGDGRTSHIKVSQKLDMMGIGAAHQKDPNGIAWKQNRDFENLLRRLNEASGKTEGDTTMDAETREEFVAETVQVKEGDENMEDEEGKKEKRERKEKKRKEKKEKKRKHDSGDEGHNEKKKQRKSSEERSSEERKVVAELDSPADTPAPAKQPIAPRYRAHRARAIAAKSIASKSSSHISEILGIAPSAAASSSESTSAIASGSATPADQGKLTTISELERLTTSTKSVADYFKEKLQLKGSRSSSTTGTPASGPGMRQRVDAYDEERPASGLGFGGGGLGFSKAMLEVKEESNVVEEATMRMGLSKFSSLTSSKFLSSETLSFNDGPAPEMVSQSKNQVEADDSLSSSSSEEESQEERRRRRKAEKERKRKEKEDNKKAKKEKKSREKGDQEHDPRQKKEKEGEKEKGKGKKEKREKKSKEMQDA
ncbi:hypothetical protein NMY22_g3119 [Coprinellus aureogranulatus]|nr:hypothetical protein NMY22_g3119 [Coprinellus aureogranulatus]